MTARRLFFWRFRFSCPVCAAEIQRGNVRAGEAFACQECGASLRARRRFGWLRWAGVLMAVIVARFSPIENIGKLFIVSVVIVFLFTLGLQFAIALVFQPDIELCSIGAHDPRVSDPGTT
jgi:predicted nucleic acid-binding Zn ribbon protein